MEEQVLLFGKGWGGIKLAIAIAVPLAWYFMYKWLQNFAYKIDITWSVFV